VIPHTHPLFVDLEQIDTGNPDVPLTQALRALDAIYQTLDEALTRTTRRLSLPCYSPVDPHQNQDGKPCSLCCHESVFLTPLEWFKVVDYIQNNFEPLQLEIIIKEAHQLYRNHQTIIEAFNQPPPAGERDHFALAKTLKFTCPLLRDDECAVYPAREILARLFGQSFNAQNGIYGCHLSGQFFASKIATLVRADVWAKRIEALPLTHFRQVYPYYFWVTYLAI